MQSQVTQYIVQPEPTHLAYSSARAKKLIQLFSPKRKPIITKTVLKYMISKRWEAMAFNYNIYFLLFSYEAKQHDENFKEVNH